MPHELDRILISASQPDFSERLMGIRVALGQLAQFAPGDGKYEQLREIILNVNRNKDKAVAEYTERFDGVKLTPGQFLVREEDLEKAHREIDTKLLESIRQAIENVREYQAEIFIGKKKHPGIKYTSIKPVGICVPGASAPLPSTVIMTAVPAIVAGVEPEDIEVVSPPRYKPKPEAKGTIHPVTLAVCYELGINRVYRVGGAQAVAALASGTDTIRKVYKIVGPGSTWVQMAKTVVFGVVDIDSLAGPSDVLIIANDKANPAWVAADMLSQAEHAPGSGIVFTDSQKLANEVLAELEKQVKQLDRTGETIRCLKDFSGIVVFDDMATIITWANNFAPEHLEIQCGEQSREIAAEIDNAGAIFIGDYSPVAVGDYWAGPSHTLPTGMRAWFFSGLTSNDFIKSTSIIEYDKEQLAESAEDIIRLAEVEGLDAHARSIKIRQQD